MSTAPGAYLSLEVEGARELEVRFEKMDMLRQPIWAYQIDEQKAPEQLFHCFSSPINVLTASNSASAALSGAYLAGSPGRLILDTPAFRAVFSSKP